MTGPRRLVKRRQVVFVSVVFGGLLAGFLVEHARRDDPFAEIDAIPARRPAFPPLVVPAGVHRLAGAVNTAAGEPAADVQVFLYATDPVPGVAEPLHWTFTGEDGRFQLDELRETTYGVALTLPGHEIASLSVTLPHTGEVAWSLPEPLAPLPVLPTIERADMLGQLFPPVGLTAAQYPVEGYEVAAVPTDANELLSGVVVRSVRTDAEGRFAFDGLVAADYRILVHPSWAVGGSWPVLDAVFHRQEPNPPRDSFLRLRLRCGEVTGLLLEPGGRPIAGAVVKVWPAGTAEHLWPPTASGPDGRFLVRDLPTGRYKVRVRAGGAAVELDVGVEAGTRLEIPFDPIEPAAQVEDGPGGS